MIYIRTFAYNAQDTIVKTIESVLNQTVKDFRYYLMDNGSTDNTGDIIREYAQKDDRIVPFYNKVNRAYDENQEFWDLTCSLQDEDYYVALDADDYYDSTFLEEILSFMKSEKLDVAACGTEFFDAETGLHLGVRGLNCPVVLDDKESYNGYFPYVHWNLRQVWGKVYSGKVAKRMLGSKKPEWWPMAYGGDTANVITCLKYAKSFGVYNKILHHYRMSKKSISHKWIEGREKCDLILHEKTYAFLEEKAGQVSEENIKFLSEVFLYAVIDTLNVLSGAELEMSKKIELINSIFTEETLQNALRINLSGRASGVTAQSTIMEYKRAFLKWILSLANNVTDKDVSVLRKYVFSFNEYFEILFTEESLVEMMRKAPNVIWCFANYDYEKALEELEELFAENDLNRIDWIVIAQNLAALSSNEEKYISYSKTYIQYLIQSGEKEAAQEELNEWLQIAPNDADFLEMRDKI